MCAGRAQALASGGSDGLSGTRSVCKSKRAPLCPPPPSQRLSSVSFLDGLFISIWRDAEGVVKLGLAHACHRHCRRQQEHWQQAGPPTGRSGKRCPERRLLH